ncbi:MAG: hypothetical protein OEV42_20895 [Deltaproteobacteria bacterium]|nr:hypothetical protein [Deltaproteobacteria bacterium]
MGLKRIRSILLFALIFCLPSVGKANWQEPIEVLTRGWGAGDNEFGYYNGEMLDTYPREFIVMSDGKIIIEDASNNRFKIFGNSGELLKAFVQSSLGIFEFNPDVIITAKKDRIKRIRTIGLFNIQSEEWLWIEPDNKVFPDFIRMTLMSEDKNSFIIPTSDSSGIEYSFSGDVLGIFTNRPFLFGKEIKDGKTNDGKANQVIQFENATYNCTVPDGFDTFRRDNDGYLYGIAHNVGKPAHTRIYKMTKCGKIIGTLDYPTAKGTYTNPYPGVPLKEAYGEPVFAQNGDVYTWKRSPEAYSILKWTWVDDPNIKEGPDMPEEVQALPSTSGVYLTWNPSPQDPGCVNSYDIERATSATGVFSNVTTVPLDEKQTYSFNDTGATAGATWYYRIMATSAIGNSDPVEVSAARP